MLSSECIVGVYLREKFCSALSIFQFPPQYGAISEQHQPAELIPMFSTIEYTITVSVKVGKCWLCCVLVYLAVSFSFTARTIPTTHLPSSS